MGWWNKGHVLHAGNDPLFVDRDPAVSKEVARDRKSEPLVGPVLTLLPLQRRHCINIWFQMLCEVGE